MIEFAYPWLFALLPLPLLLRRLLPAHREQREAVRAPFIDKLVDLTGQTPGEGAVELRASRVQRALFAASWILAIVALARPQWIEEPITRVIPSRDLLLAIDLSGSMETPDATDAAGEPVDRLTAVKEVLDEFLERREGDRVGLIFFGSAPFVQVPFTSDLNVCRMLLDEAEVRMAGPQTMLGDAIGLGINVFEESELEDRVLILFTDGNDTGSQVPPQNAAGIARDRGITIHTVAFGDPQAVGEQKFDEQTLRDVADTSGGQYFYAANREELEAVYVQLDQLETRDAEEQTYRPRSELFQWPLAVLVIITLMFHAIQIGISIMKPRRTIETSHA